MFQAIILNRSHACSSLAAGRRNSAIFRGTCLALRLGTVRTRRCMSRAYADR
ncbi:hypothetical protein BIFPSEUDO_03239 [Bifidobacterium pseudocatenulatum DSM 20438 = JCM 1200 = LMG 10505]|uniref:Uncharacterized protein n=1 Tax=Bifidobacterium pseudocatenulatum DSM 20438 = JCM 1200 = LMG 10505 TaxID=547043 RepID=C0BRH5_BIFPS|nr:hypothetical protein BIFPSEUDO_03239 [Bifidobacterium pseudocatenulatum DSM 20438 = JCM 1200 = LMG 10505]